MWLQERLLKEDDRLAKLRFRLVPARLKEPAFWHQYFEQLVLRVTENILSKGQNRSGATAAGSSTPSTTDAQQPVFKPAPSPSAAGAGAPMQSAPAVMPSSSGGAATAVRTPA